MNLKIRKFYQTQKKDISEFQEEQLEVKQAVTIFQVVSMLQRYQKAEQPKKVVLKSEI